MARRIMKPLSNICKLPLSNICKLPLELMVKVLNCLNYEEANKTIDVCDHFQRGVCYLLQMGLTNLRSRVNNEISLCLSKLDNLPLNEEYLRMDFLKLLSFLRFLLTEIDIFFALIWRYRSSDLLWSRLCPLIAPVIEEFNRNIDQQINVRARHLDVNIHNLRNTFPMWHLFLTHYDNLLCAELDALTPNPLSFEIMAIDIITCCPSINFQIAFKRFISRTKSNNDSFNIYSFFKLSHLKPACQIPNVHNSELNDKNKKTQLIKFLRECVQWENFAHLQEILNEILELEMKLWTSLDVEVRDCLIKQLNVSYRNIQTNPYEPIQRNTSILYSDEGTRYSEYYCRFNSYNESFTGLRCIVDTPNQKIENLPLIYSMLKGWTRNSLHETIGTNEKINFDNIGSHFTFVPLKEEKSRKKPRFQLIIHYRERLFSTPAEAIINISYDEMKDCHITMDFIGSEPFISIDGSNNMPS